MINSQHYWNDFTYNTPMSILTRFTAETAQLILPQDKYVKRFRDTSGKSTPKSIYLTFDDGPHADYTPRILDQLAVIQAKATFFILGQNAKRLTPIIRRTLSEGHSIGTHSWSHWNAKNVPVKEWIKDVHRARKIVEDVTGRSCKLFRPPYGDLTPLSLLALLKSSFRVVQWSQDTRDFEARTSSDFCQWFLDNKPNSGNIILLHDNQEVTCDNLQIGCLNWQPYVDFLAIPMV